MIIAVDERPAIRVRPGQYVVLVAARRRGHPWNLVALRIEGRQALDVVAVARTGLVAVQVGDAARDHLALYVVPGAGADAIARIDSRGSAALFLAHVCAPGT